MSARGEQRVLKAVRWMDTVTESPLPPPDRVACCQERQDVLQTSADDRVRRSGKGPSNV